MGFSCKFSLKPIHWTWFSTCQDSWPRHDPGPKIETYNAMATACLRCQGHGPPQMPWGAGVERVGLTIKHGDLNAWYVVQVVFCLMFLRNQQFGIWYVWGLKLNCLFILKWCIYIYIYTRIHIYIYTYTCTYIIILLIYPVYIYTYYTICNRLIFSCEGLGV